MKNELEIKDLLKERLEDFKHFTTLTKTLKKNKTFNKHMASACYGSIVALLEVLDNKNLTSFVQNSCNEIISWQTKTCRIIINV